jgi:uncharacterized RDD family membrane protein YckC
MSERTRRLAALGLDYLVILAWMIVLGLVTAIIFLTRGELPDTLGKFGPIGSEILYFLLLTFVVGVYLYKTESGPRRSTWGKRRMGLEVTGLDGSVPKPTKILLRTIVKLLPWETAHFFIWQLMGVVYRDGNEATPRAWIFVGMHTATAAAIVYIVMVLATGRGPHDLAAGTRVRLRAVPAS